MIDKHLKANQKLWDVRTNLHLQSKFYDVPAFLREEKSLISKIEWELLGDVSGKKILHLQCHFGQDSITLARNGAKVTGVDFSKSSITAARSLNSQLGLDCKFIQADVLKLNEVIDDQYDIVFTSFGIVGWFDDLETWASNIYKTLRPGGRVVYVDFHPVLWMYNDEFTKFQYPYLRSIPIEYQTQSTYADEGGHEPMTAYCWNHGMSEIITSWIDAGIHLTHFSEYDYSPHNCFPDTIQHPKGCQIKALAGNIPMCFGLVGERP